MRFVQFGDCHLDSATGGALGLPEEKRAELRRNVRRAVERACGLAIERRADAVLITGDLFDYESLRPETVAFLARLFAGLAPIPIFISPGNHDSLRPASPYMDPGKWPGNVHVFRSSEFETVRVDSLDCGVTGIAHAHRGITGRLIGRPIERERAGVDLLVFHGSRDGYRPSEKESVIPFSDQELFAQGFDYAAVGHYHSFAEIADGSGAVRGAYSGCVQGRGLDEAGEKCALVGEITPGSRVEIEWVEVGERRIVRVEADMTGAGSAEAALARIERALDASGAREQDIVDLRLVGALAPGVELDTGAVEASGRHWHVCVRRAGLEADYDIEALMAESASFDKLRMTFDGLRMTVRSAFVRRMAELVEQAGEDEAAMRDAVYYGLAALDSRKIAPRASTELSMTRDDDEN